LVPPPSRKASGQGCEMNILVRCVKKRQAREAFAKYLSLVTPMSDLVRTRLTPPTSGTPLVSIFSCQSGG
jgi:hypothetical protein